jgi:hypothetical protein
VEAQAVDDLLDQIGAPTTLSFREAGKALREAGHSAANGPLSAAVKARKLRLDHPLEGVPRNTTEHHGTPGGSVPGTPPPLGGVRNTPGLRSGTPDQDPDELVSCKRCFSPTTAGKAQRTGGLCATCNHTTTHSQEDTP